jgi:chromosome partitioning protein
VADALGAAVKVCGQENFSVSELATVKVRPFKIAIGSQKGGVSKTTTTLSLGACLAASNGAPAHNVLLIDLDPQANLTMALGVNPGTVRRMIGDALLEQASLLAVSRESAIPNLDLVPANQGLLVLDKVLFGRPGFEYRLKQQLGGPIAQQYDIALFDCPPAFGTLTMNALTAADLLVIPVPCDYFSARSLQQFLELVTLVQRNTNPALRYRILITMYDKRNRISHIIQDQLRRKFGPAMLNTIISIDTKLRESPVVGQPITQYAPNSRSAQEYHALATELMQDEQTPATSQAAT